MNIPMRWGALPPTAVAIKNPGGTIQRLLLRSQWRVVLRGSVARKAAAAVAEAARKLYS